MKFLDEEQKCKICKAAQKRMSVFGQEDFYSSDDLIDACIIAGKAAIFDFIGECYGNQTVIRLYSFDEKDSIMKFTAIDADYQAKIFHESDTICSAITISLPENVTAIFNYFSPPENKKNFWSV